MNALRRAGERVFVPDAETPGRTPLELVVVALSAIVLSVVTGLRSSAATTTVWAEDGREFLGPAVRGAGVDALRWGYSGYAHVVPRLIGAVVAALPPADAAWALGVGACLVTGALAAFCASATRPHIRTTTGRSFYAATIVLLPIAGFEALGNIANLHWFLLLGAFWAIVWRPASPAGIVVSCVVVAAAALSDPITALLVPLAAWRCLTVVGWRERAVVVTYAAALAFQASVIVASSQSDAPAAFARVPRLFGTRVIVASVLGVRGTGQLIDRLGASAADGVALALIAGLVALWWRRAGTERLFLGILAGVAVAVFVVCSGLRGGSSSLVSGVLAGGSRYAVVPALLLVAGTIMLAERVDRRLAISAMVVVISVAIVDFHVSLRTDELTWARGLAIAETRCRFGVDPTRIPVEPVMPDDTWNVVVPCSYLDR